MTDNQHFAARKPSSTIFLKLKKQTLKHKCVAFITIAELSLQPLRNKITFLKNK